jgi:1-phosphofructokinase family hexose kinase
MGIETTPLLLLGRENAREYEAAVRKHGLNPRIIYTEGRIRENLTLHSESGETRISYKGFEAPKGLAEIINEEISPEPCDILTLTGRLPEGVRPSELLPYLTELRDKGVRIVLDSRSYKGEDIRALRPWLIKPNREEIESYIDKRIDDPEELCSYADKVRELGAELTLVTLDKNGAALITNDGVMILHAPHVKVKSTIGAGDSAIAGFIYAAKGSRAPLDALRYAVAFGSAAAMTDGTEPPRRDDINTVLNKLI